MDTFYYLCFVVVFVNAMLSFPCSLAITCLERTDSFNFFRIVFSFIVTFQYGVPGEVCYLIVLFPDLCLPLYFS